MRTNAIIFFVGAIAVILAVVYTLLPSFKTPTPSPTPTPEVAVDTMDSEVNKYIEMTRQCPVSDPDCKG